jgi:4-amino-4-deoxy-L-arabinose transferase-like glycosyltransferase
LATVFLLGRKLWGFDTGVRALLYTSASTLFVLLGHQLTLDMLLCFCLLAALSCFLMAQARRDGVGNWRIWMLGCWIAMALAVLAKGLIGVLIPAVTVGLYVVWQRDWVVLRRLNLRWGLPLFAVIAAPWFVLAARADPRFLTFFFVREHFQRFLTPIEHRTEPWWFFLPVLFVGIMPWFHQAVRAVVMPFSGRMPPGQFDASRLLWLWCVFVLIFFSCSDAKLIPYILPAVPALALLCASQPAGDSRGSLLTGASLSLMSSLGLLLYANGLWSSVETRTLLLSIGRLLFGTSALLALGALACGFYVLRRRPRAALAGLCSAWFLASATILVAADAAAGLFSAKDSALELRLAGAADPADPLGVPIFAVQTYPQSLPFYLRRSMILVDYRGELDFGLAENPQRGIPTLQQFAEVWQTLSAGFAVMPPSTRDKLSALGVPMREIARFPEQVVISRH